MQNRCPSVTIKGPKAGGGRGLDRGRRGVRPSGVPFATGGCEAATSVMVASFSMLLDRCGSSRAAVVQGCRFVEAEETFKG